jgi:hypothetical protein
LLAVVPSMTRWIRHESWLIQVIHQVLSVLECVQWVDARPAVSMHQV